MNTYIVNFAAYTFAMIGFLFVTGYIYKKSVSFRRTDCNKNFLRVENSLRLSATKTVYVLSAGNEKFLIAGDPANTTMLAKLDNEKQLEKDTYKVADFSNAKIPLTRMNRG